MNYINKGPNYSKGYNVYDIAVVDAVTLEELAQYTGYHNRKTKKIRLYPICLTDEGKRRNYKLEKQTLDQSQVLDFNRRYYDNA